MSKRSLTDYLPDKTKEKTSVNLKIDKDLYKEGQRLLKKRGNTVTDLIEAAFRQLIDEAKND